MYFVLNKQIKTPIDLKKIPKNIIKIPINPDSFTILKSKKEPTHMKRKMDIINQTLLNKFSIFLTIFLFLIKITKIKIIKINKIFIN